MVKDLKSNPRFLLALLGINRCDKPNDLSGTGIRFHFGPGYRVYYAKDGDLIVLLYGGTKKSQDRDIERASEYWQDYLTNT